MPCRVVTARAGTTAMPAFVRNVLAAVPTMGEVTGSFWGDALTLGVRGRSRTAPMSVAVVHLAVMVGSPITPGVVPSSSVVLVSVLLDRAAHTVRAAGTMPPSPVSP